MTASVKTGYYPYFDYLRITLACVVMLYHDKVIHWQNIGSLAVQVFFALSGWLIGGILLKLSLSDLPRFYFNRAVRIWIPYFIALSLIIIVSLIKDPIDAKWVEFVFYKLTFVYNLFGPPQIAQFRLEMPLDGTANHFWSVNAEEQFYLIAPLFLVLLNAKLGRSMFLWLCCALLAWITNVYSSIVFGVLAAVIFHRYGAVHLGHAARIGLFMTLLFSVIGLLSDWSYVLISPIFSISLVMLLAINGAKNKFGSFVGGMSYPLYLNHWIGVFAGNSLLGPFGLRESFIRQLLAIVINLAVAAILYWVIERRVLESRAEWYTFRRGVVCTLVAYGMVMIGMISGALFW